MVGMVPRMNKDNAASQTTLSNFIMLTCECSSGCVCVGLIRAGRIAADRQQWSIWGVGQRFVQMILKLPLWAFLNAAPEVTQVQ